MGTSGPPRNLATGIVKALRPRQWVKNVLVVGVPVVTVGASIHDWPAALGQVGIAIAVFCLASSSIYLVNDARDVEADRRHPTKRYRPIAAEVVAPALAYGLAVGLAVAALAVALLVAPALALVVAIYLVMQLAYCFGLKHQAVLDICLVASAYLVRATASGAATGVALSRWFLVILTFMALFMAAGKRYSELQLAERTGAAFRDSLQRYSAPYLRFVWTLAGTCVVVLYAMWAFEQDRDGISWFAASAVPITVAILRYARDVDGGMAGEPEDIFLHDRVIQLLILGWIVLLCCAMWL